MSKRIRRSEKKTQLGGREDSVRSEIRFKEEREEP
jgi:hypothetical protein